MNMLVDTHAMLWFAAGDDRLSPTARATIEDPETTTYISVASWWEIAIKCSVNKLQLDLPLEKFMAHRIDEGFRVLTIDTQHLPALTTLPFHHRDPFDRLIICQAMAEDMPVCTGDSHFAGYEIRLVW
ncbi:MAG: type II toxin-antitoxin system VapC family toxin [Kiritimatiellia bacterium]|jgi:PIN domain nuclease of toxin-antitoxin system|nr:type II toxin-antitoxin system VapC family toxin [Kiritimatiellia bacterium]MDP6810174.1 type II toxin-antitoxin system VapC family toxin [Kiritimatiellia bacterium]MDP7022920.1 type II toxin-antitoxin system VapC family toxin [Kiritimatiellia bacterium]